MSYILDALKRAERERKQGQVSVLDEIPAAPAAEPRRRLPPLLIPVAAGAVVLGGLIYGLVAWHHHSGAAAPAAPAHPPVALAPPPAAVAPPPQAAPPPAAPTATIEDGARLNSLDDMQAPGPPPPAPVEEPAPPPGPPPAAMSARRPPPARIQPPADAAPTADNPPQDTVSPADTTPAEAAPAPPPATADHQLQEMPENFRAGFPALTVDVHVYNSDPQRRFVLISGKRYHEGDTLAEGPRIVGIVPEGIVFDWQGQRVLYAISH